LLALKRTGWFARRIRKRQLKAALSYLIESSDCYRLFSAYGVDWSAGLEFG